MHIEGWTPVSVIRPPQGVAPRVLVLVGLMAAVWGGCDSRSYDNPLDPRNGSTGGVAPGFNATAGDGKVEVEWPDLELDDLETVRILRTWTAGAVETLGVLPADETRWTDSSAANGAAYEYRVRYVVEGDATVHLSNSDVATPGPERPWVVDERWGGLWRISPDGRDLVWKLPYEGYLRSLTVDRRRDRVWVASWSRDEVISVDASGSVAVKIPVESPVKMAVFEEDGSLWVAAAWGVGHYTVSGEALLEDRTVANPKDIAVDPVRGRCWVAEGSGSVWIREPDGTTARVGGFTYPFALSVDPESGEAWLADASLRRVYRLEAGGPSVVGSVGSFVQPVDVAASPDGGAWVADWGGNSVVRLNGLLDRDLTVAGFDHPRAVAVDPSSGTCWVVAAYGGRVTKLASDGERLGWAGGLDFPKDIAIDPGPVEGQRKAEADR